jgi:ribosomal-protein-alanine N-acetyltransferase
MVEDIARGEAAFWVLTDPDDDRALAYLGFFRWDVPHQTAELGYVLVRSRWGQGLMSEVLPMLVRFGFEQLGLHRMDARVEPEHGASVRL